MKHATTPPMVMLLSILAACGGGGSTSGSTAALTVKGTAAKGAAIAGATVAAKCNGGTGTAVTAADGTYTIELTSGSGSCVLKVSTSGGDFYSVAAGRGTTLTANLTPATQLIVANLTGQDPATFYSGFSASDAAAITPTAVDAAQTAVAAVLKNNGVDTAAAGNLLTGNLVAANGSTPGNALDQVLDAFAGKLGSAGVTLAQLTATVVQSSPTNAVTATSATPSVAADVALQPGAAACSALRSGTYRLVIPKIGAAGSFGNESTMKVTIDGATLEVTFADNTSTTLVPMPGTACRFTDAAGADLVVSQAGVLVLKSADVLSGIGFPEQALTLADLAGDWNSLEYDRGDISQPLAPTALTGSINSTGNLTITTSCIDAKACSPASKTVSITVNAAGGFDVNFSATDRSRLFAYRAGGGEMIMVGVATDGTHGISTHVRTLSLPVVSDVNLGWVAGTTNNLVGATYELTGFDVGEYSNTVTAVDGAKGTFARSSVINFTGPVTRPESFTVNQVAGGARNGYIYRVPEIVTTSAGKSSTVREAVFMPLRGMGVTVGAFPAASPAQADVTSYQYYVAKP